VRVRATQLLTLALVGLGRRIVRSERFLVRLDHGDVRGNGRCERDEV
jgi:hypothetical protein